MNYQQEYYPPHRPSNAPGWIMCVAFAAAALACIVSLFPSVVSAPGVLVPQMPLPTARIVRQPAAVPLPLDAAAANAESLRQYQAAVDAANAASAPAAPAPAPCTLITWADGSQGCNDGRAISAAQSQPGYCVPITWDDGTISCNDGKPSGLVVWPVAPAAQPTPWPAAPSDGVRWTSAAGPNGGTCVTVGDQTACSDAGVTLDSDDAAFVARMIEDGKIKQGKGAPHG